MELFWNWGTFRRSDSVLPECLWGTMLEDVFLPDNQSAIADIWLYDRADNGRRIEHNFNWLASRGVKRLAIRKEGQTDFVIVNPS